MEKKSINEEQLREMNSLSIDGSSRTFDNSTSPDTFIGIKEDF